MRGQRRALGCAQTARGRARRPGRSQRATWEYSVHCKQPRATPSTAYVLPRYGIRAPYGSLRSTLSAKVQVTNGY